ncbi:glutamine amidotransferase [Actinomyces sp. B33]|uniref:glutamine amidotransferase-related protein n=1 Tax=Actinomyces sp. B33 TaxID=2942131 RepID=UPI0023410895|nr:glutamine amidotransferase [Actinomyces sp. B33]MDC4233916.1 glutamine amidotransferase [Actinomyces sp. B33]
MKRFLLVSTRPEDEAIDAEYHAFRVGMGLAPEGLEQIRLDMLGLPDIDLDDYSGVVIAGSSYGTTTADDAKTATQKAVESELMRLFGDIIDAGTPCLTTGFGTEVATVFLGGLVSRRWAEDPQIAEIIMTTGAWDEPIFAGLDREFSTFVGHHEAVEVVPAGADVLARSLTCPVEVMRIGERFYALQFNPELDSVSIARTLERYEDAGYPGTDDPDEFLRIGREGAGDHPAAQILKNFVSMFSS